MEAESVAYTVAQHYGIETSDYSFAYIAGWSAGKDTPELKASLDRIRAAADTVDDLMLILECSRHTVYELLKKNEFRCVKLGGRGYRISRKSFDEWLDKQSC